MSEAAKKPFDPNEFIVETDRMMKEAKKKKEFDPDEFIRETDALLQPQGTNKTGGFAVGLAESYNPLSLIRPAETFGREVLNTKTELVPDPHGGITFKPVNAEEARAKAEKDTVTPAMDVKSLIGYTGDRGKKFVENLNPTAEKAGMLMGTALSFGEGGLKLIGKPGMFSKLTKEGRLLSKEAQAAKAEEKFMQTTSEILGENDPTKIKDIQQNVGRIEELVNKGRNNEAGLDVTDKIRTELKTIQDRLGKDVGKAKEKVFADTKTQIPVKNIKTNLDTLVQKTGSLTTRETILSGKELKDVQELQKLLSTPTRNPSDLLKIAERIDGMTQPDRVAKDNIGETALYVMRQTRRDIKNELYPRFEGYKQVDAPYSTYKDHVEAIEGKINGINGESYVKNLFNSGKTEARNDLEASLSLAGGTSAPETFKEIRSINVANDIIGKGDVRLDQANRVFQKYRDQRLTQAQHWGQIGGGLFGLATGSNLTGGSGFGAGSLAVGGLGQYIAGETLKSIFKSNATKYGHYMASPDRIFETAKTANKLSSEAKQLAADIQTASQVQGGIDKLLPYISALPAFKEFLTFAQSQQESTK